jgi:membrane protease YdiL (CAAX protease family)
MTGFEHTQQAEHDRASRWVRFWDAGTWWKALLFLVAYWGVYQLLALGVTTLAAGLVERDDILSTPLSVLLGVAVPILLAGVLLLLFAQSLGWLRPLFARQPVRGRAWMWVAVVLVLIPIVVRLVATRWSAWSVAQVLAILFLGLCIGLTEELATRGIIVRMLRGGGYHERLVFVLSSLFFALLHAGNIISGQDVATVALTVVYAFGFGAMMYLALRVTGRLVWVILLHAATDPTTILAAGGIDTHSPAAGGSTGLLSIAGLFSIAYIAVALLAVFLVTDRTRDRDPDPEADRAARP